MKASRGINERVAQGPSAWSQRMLEKQGWSKGKGLGKKEDGMVTYVKVAKKEDNAALGFKEAESVKSNEQWYFGDPFSSASVGGKAAVKLQAGRDSDDSADSDASSASSASSSRGSGGKRPRPASAPAAAAGDAVELSAAAFPGAPQGHDVQEFYKKLFKATGGARLGMRARRDQPGKWDRAEARQRALADAAPAAAPAPAADAAAEGGREAAQDKAARKAARRALREEAQRREEKAQRKRERREQRLASASGES